MSMSESLEHGHMICYKAGGNLWLQMEAGCSSADFKIRKLFYIICVGSLSLQGSF